MYGYAGRLDEIRDEYNLIEGYLDNAGAPLYPKSIPLNAGKLLSETVLVNPHSRSKLSYESAALIDNVRKQVLDLFSADPSEYAVVFTANATAAAKIVGEALGNTNYTYLRDSHTSLVGLRSLAKSYNVVDTLEGINTKGSLVAYPLQSNFDGKRYPENWASNVSSSGGLSMVDMAAYCASALPDFQQFKPDFAILSFYKMFGLPDLGALIVNKRPQVRQFLLQRAYFGGGTVAALTAEKDYMVRQSDLATSLEDGTPPFHTILFLKVAIEEFKRIFGSFRAISDHTAELTIYCRKKLEEADLCNILSPAGNGPIVTFTLKHGGYYDFSIVAGEVGVYVRTGTLCNTGAFTLASKWTDDEIASNNSKLGKTCNDETDFIDGKHTGVIRASFGPYNSFSDVDKLVNCIKDYFGPKPAPSSGLPMKEGIITDLVIYPIKSCGGTKVTKSEVSEQGLKWDREFCLVDPSTRKVLSLKRNLKMANLKSQIDEIQGALVVTMGASTLQVPLSPQQWLHAEKPEHADKCGAGSSKLILNLDEKVVCFFTEAIGTPCTIAKADEADRFAKATRAQTLANTSPLLFVSETSADALGLDYRVFRGNIIFKSAEPFAEDAWKQVKINQETYDMSGPCQRCNMVCVTPEGKSDARPYLELTKHRKTENKIYFGMLGGLSPKSASDSKYPIEVALGDLLIGLS